MTSRRAHLIRGSDAHLIAIRPDGVSQLHAAGLGAMYDHVWPVLRHDASAARHVDPDSAVGRFVHALESLGVLPGEPSSIAAEPADAVYVTRSPLRALRACATPGHRVVVLLGERSTPAEQRAMEQWGAMISRTGGPPRLLRTDSRGVGAFPLPTRLDRLADWLEQTALLGVQVPNRMPAATEPWHEGPGDATTHREGREARTVALLDALLLSASSGTRGWRCGLTAAQAEARARSLGGRTMASGAVHTVTLTAFGVPVPAAILRQSPSRQERAAPVPPVARGAHL